MPIDTDARPAVKLLIPLTPNLRQGGPSQIWVSIISIHTNDAWRGHEITRGADALVPFGFLPKRARPATTYRED